MSSIVSVSAVAVFAALCGLLIKKANGEIALLLSVCGVFLIGYAALSKAEILLDWINTLLEESLIGDTFSVMLKTLGAAITAKIASSLCSDCGENTLAICVAFTSKIVIILLSVPLLEQFLALVEEILVL